MTPPSRVELPHLDHLVATACQLSCTACTNAVGFIPQEIYPVDELKAEMDAAAEVMHTHVLCLLGGEPLVHKGIVELMRHANASALCDRVQVLTNGMRLHMMKDEFWAELDQLKISIYPDRTQPENVQLAKDKAAEYGFFLDFYDVAADPFRAVHRAEPASPEVAQATYDGCWYRTFTRKLERQHVYRCCTSPTISKDIMGLPPDADGIPLDGLTPDGLREFLDRPTYMASCTRCYGNTGPRLGEWSEVRGDKTRWLAESAR